MNAKPTKSAIVDTVDFHLSNHYPTQTRRLRLILFCTFCLLLTGFISPIITLKKFVVLENTFSVFSGTLTLLNENQYFLFAMVAGFSIVIPLLKIGILMLLLSTKPYKAERLKNYLHWMHLYGKWSMLDVFVVAILVVAVKLGVIASVEMRFGLYAFATAVILTMYVTARVVSLSDDIQDNH